MEVSVTTETIETMPGPPEDAEVPCSCGEHPCTNQEKVTLIDSMQADLLDLLDCSHKTHQRIGELLFQWAHKRSELEDDHFRPSQSQ